MQQQLLARMTRQSRANERSRFTCQAPSCHCHERSYCQSGVPVKLAQWCVLPSSIPLLQPSPLPLSSTTSRQQRASFNCLCCTSSLTFLSLNHFPPTFNISQFNNVALDIVFLTMSAMARSPPALSPPRYGTNRFGAIGEEIKASPQNYISDISDDDCDGGVLLASPCTSNGSAESLRELVEDSEPLVDESPRAARLLANFYFEGPAINAMLSSPGTHQSPPLEIRYFTSMFSPAQASSSGRFIHQEIGSPPPTTSSRNKSPQKVLHPRSMSNASSFSTFSNVSSSSFDQKSYKELFNNINDKINLVTRQYVGLPYQSCFTEQMDAFIELTARHVNYRKVAIAMITSGQHSLHQSLIHGMTWRLVSDLIFDLPLLDQAPSRAADDFLLAWKADVGCCTIKADDWSIKGPLMKARIAAARRVIETTPRFNDFIKDFAAKKTDEIVAKLRIAWRPNTTSRVREDLLDPIEKLVRIAIRMRAEMKAFEFKFYEYACKGSATSMILHAEAPGMAPPNPADDEDHFVICTKTPQVFEKDYRPESKCKECIYKAEVLAREKHPGYLDGLGDRYRRFGARARARSTRHYNPNHRKYTV
ncbi:hypothetical protein CERZMDRAFT_83492 [Cercospora zeae-maydis SCOH1-5]|uniref:Uncharacterized protein n=1 Tax=Cercospora zeae-maydis SCOH1-5 TaxID=717836 RepID=A0A6A6FLN4_9PEZI|nr:hypothetical protein CERZMDRAFT_83492 [Cercospora zeae-maydis SCOH1-5]